MSQHWFVRREDREQGPLSPQELKRLVANGQLLRSDLVRSSERPEWRQAGKVKGLFDLPAAAPEDASTLEGGAVDQVISHASKPPQRPLTKYLAMGGAGALVTMLLCCGGLAFVGSLSKSDRNPTVDPLNGGSAAHVFSAADYALPGGTKKETRESDTRAGGWVYDEGYLSPGGEFILHGTSIVWHDKGKQHKKYTIQFRHDKRHGKSEGWHQNEARDYEEWFVEDKAHGPVTKWWPNGQKKLSATMADGTTEGEYTEWDEKGAILKAGVMKKSAPVGKWRFGFKPLVSGDAYLLEADDGRWRSGSRADFICKLFYLNFKQGSETLMMPKENRAGPCLCQSKEDFINSFGPPASDTGAGALVRRWTYRCSDGEIVLRARSNAPTGAPWVIEVQ